MKSDAGEVVYPGGPFDSIRSGGPFGSMVEVGGEVRWGGCRVG